MLGRGLTVSMHCNKSSEKIFDIVLTKCVCCIVPSDSSGIVGVRPGEGALSCQLCTDA